MPWSAEGGVVIRQVIPSYCTQDAGLRRRAPRDAGRQRGALGENRLRGRGGRRTVAVGRTVQQGPGAQPPASQPVVGSAGAHRWRQPLGGTVFIIGTTDDDKERWRRRRRQFGQGARFGRVDRFGARGNVFESAHLI